MSKTHIHRGFHDVDCVDYSSRCHDQIPGKNPLKEEVLWLAVQGTQSSMEVGVGGGELAHTRVDGEG